MTEHKSSSPLLRFWNVFSSIMGVIGTAGMIDDIANWGGLIKTVVRGYSEIVHPILSPITHLVHFPSWFTDYLFIGLMVAGARTRPTYNHMKPYWKIDISGYSWYAFWAPHRLAVFIISIFMALFWPFTMILFIPPDKLKVPKENNFQYVVWRDQLQWLIIYAVTLIGLIIVNAGLKVLIMPVK